MLLLNLIEREYAYFRKMFYTKAIKDHNGHSPGSMTLLWKCTFKVINNRGPLKSRMIEIFSIIGPGPTVKIAICKLLELFLSILILFNAIIDYKFFQ